MSPSLSAVLHGALLLLLARCVHAWVGGERQRLHLVMVVFGLLVAVACAVLAVPAAAIPADWFTPLHEGNGLSLVDTLHGRSAHAGPNLRAIFELVAGGARVTPGDMMRANLLLTGVAGALYFGMARAVLASWWAALALAVVFVGNRNAVDAAVSELPGPLLAVYLLAGVVSVASWWRARTGWDRAAAALCLVLLTVLAGATRIETVVLPIGAALALALHAFAGPERLDAAGRRVIAWLDAASRWPWPILVVVFAVLVIPWWPKPADSEAHWLAEAVWPLNLSPVMLFFWAADAVPVAAVVLAFFGTVHAFRTPIRAALLPISLLLLWRLYYSAGHGYRPELHRYGTMVLPGLLVLGLWGWREITALGDRLGGDKRWRRPAVAALLLLGFVDMGYGVQGQSHYPAYARTVTSADLQVEARFLVAAIRRHRGCIFVAPVLGHGDDPQPRYVLFGAPLADPVEIPRTDTALGRELADLPSTGCIVLYRGRDCSLRDRPDCSDVAVEGPLMARRQLTGRAWNHSHFGVARTPFELSLHRIRR